MLRWTAACSPTALDDPERMEATLALLPGVVESGIFARRRADVALVGSEAGVRTLTAPA